MPVRLFHHLNFFNMKNVSKKGWLVIPQLSLFFLVLGHLPVNTTPSSQVCITCSIPSASIASRTSSSISFSWYAVTGASSYKIYYQRSEGGYVSQEFTTGNTSIAFSDLPPGTYTFYIAAVCGSETSDFIVFDDLIMG